MTHYIDCDYQEAAMRRMVQERDFLEYRKGMGRLYMNSTLRAHRDGHYPCQREQVRSAQLAFMDKVTK